MTAKTKLGLKGAGRDSYSKLVSAYPGASINRTSNFRKPKKSWTIPKSGSSPL